VSPLSEVIDNPTPDVAKQCLTWNGRKYFISEKPLLLPDAQSLATRLKGRLLTISSAEEEEFILAQGRGLALWMAGWQPPEMNWRDERNRPLRFIGTLQPRTLPIKPVATNLTIFTAGDRRGWNALGPIGTNICHACIEWGEECSSDLKTKTQELKPLGPSNVPDPL
jgi:hypothetical protein